jgi:uncharacterized protein involved in outer membrane biogenesis
MHRSRAHRVARGLARWVLGAAAALLLVVAAALAGLQTGWAKGYLRGLIVRQANQYLTATLEIGTLEGSLLRGIELGDVRLSRDGEPIVAIDRVTVSYTIRELIDRGVTIARIHVVGPRVVAERQPDGRWNLAALVRRDAREEERRGPRRPIHIRAIEVVDGEVRRSRSTTSRSSGGSTSITPPGAAARPISR